MRKSIDLNPKDAEAYNNYGAILQELGKFKEAELSYKNAITLEPNYIEALNNLGTTLIHLKKFKKSIEIFTKVIFLKPDYALSHYNLGIAFKSLGKFEDAEICFNKAVELKPDYAEAYNNLSNTLKAMGRLKDAIISYKKAIRLRSEYSKVYNNLGVTFQELGNFQDAITYYSQAIALQPDYAEAHRCLTLIKKYLSKDKQYLQMEKLYLDKNITKQKRCEINFALAKACEDLGEFKKAFNYYKEGNALRKDLLNYNIDEDRKLFSQIRENYSFLSQNLLNLNDISKTIIPIFIIGMPRSGTTLVEQIISSHSLVMGGGELIFIKKFGGSLANGSSKISRTTLLNFRNNYLQKLMNISDKHNVITDKMPQNFLYLGLISTVFPEAKIIHVKRDPAAVCWSNFKHYFTPESLRFCYSLDDIINYYKLYEDLMRFWEKSINCKIFNLDYDFLTNNQKSETKRLVDHIGLNWDERCLLPEQNTRNVATASNIQIREKIYQDSSKKWKSYETFLEGAFDNI